MTWKHFFNMTLTVWVVSLFPLIYASAECYDPCNNVFWCDKKNPCLAPVLPAASTVECEIAWTSGPFSCCCTTGNDCCQYQCYGGICLTTGNKVTYAYDGRRVTGAYCDDPYCKVRV